MTDEITFAQSRFADDLRGAGSAIAPITSAEESARIAKLTSDAIRASGEKIVEDIKRTIEAAEQATAMLRLEADNLSEEVRRHTGTFADRVSGYVDNCHGAVRTFRVVQGKLGEMTNNVVNFEPPDHK